MNIFREPMFHKVLTAAQKWFLVGRHIIPKVAGGCQDRFDGNRSMQSQSKLSLLSCCHQRWSLRTTDIEVRTGAGKVRPATQSCAARESLKKRKNVGKMRSKIKLIWVLD